MSEAPSVWPLGLYAPGKYICKCAICEKQFDGDKRAVQCLECAVRHLRISAEAAECKVVELEEERDEARADAKHWKANYHGLLSVSEEARLGEEIRTYERDFAAEKLANAEAERDRLAADKARLSEANRELHRRAQAAEGKLQRAEHAAREQIDILTSLATKLGHWPVGLSRAKTAMEQWIDARAALSGSVSGWRLVPYLWQCKDYADGWLSYTNEDEAQAYQRDTGCAVRITYRPLPAAPQQGGE